jgi:integrase
MLSTTTAVSAPATVRELADRYLAWADTYYRHQARPGEMERTPTREITNVRDSLRWLLPIAGDVHPEHMTAQHLLAVVDALLAHRKRDGLPPTRLYVNCTIKRLRRMFRWAAKPVRGWVPSAVITDLQLVESLPLGRTDARESERVTPVPMEDFTATISAIATEGMRNRREALWAKQLSIMLELQWHSGMRPGELCSMKASEMAVEKPTQPSLFSPAGVEIMVYRPTLHKTRHHGLDRNIFLGPEARRLVEDWLLHLRIMAGATGTPRDRLFTYSSNSLGAAVRKVCRRHDIPLWSPNQVRHAFATRLRSQAGIDVVQVLMGHRHRTTTEIYAQPDAIAAIDAIWRFG